ncbi:GTPase [Clostridium sp. DJ247]|uniref:GTPase family protein n=1 Tax=Clostridium sp. DJ247 TaxID=2726188 RepID=UPI00162669A8|nr:GTPase [Clostridium sp. DJ247]MBC2579357.1 Flp pilus assembly complex ATPase component TadA [Clostridium sp. DJ247]
MESVLDKVKNELNKVNLDEETKQAIKQKINELEKNELNIMITGATGSGKSSTINALFNDDVAKVGQDVDPETMTIKKYELDNIILWDTPGLGDSPEQDKYYAKNIVELLNKKDDRGKAVVDLVLVVVDGSAKDMRTSFELINEVIIPNISDKNRILVAINQCDMAMKGREWDSNLNIPKEDLIKFLDKKVESVKNRIYDSTGVEIKPIYYSALYKYNISKLLCYIIKSTPDEKRIIYIDKINKNPEVWKNNDALMNYNYEIQNEMKGSLTNALDCAAKGALAGAAVGTLVPVIGPIVGAGIGAALGFIGGLFGI